MIQFHKRTGHIFLGGCFDLVRNGADNQILGSHLVSNRLGNFRVDKLSLVLWQVAATRESIDSLLVVRLD